MYIRNKLLTSTLAISLASSLYGYELKPVGFKAMGMGGTGVASTRGSLSGYYNPALLRMSDYTSEFSLNVSARLREANLADNMDKLSDINFETTLDNIANNAATGNRNITVGSSTTSISGTSNSATDISNIETAITTIDSIGQSNALQVAANLSLAAQISDSFSIGIYGAVDVGMQMIIDRTNLDLIFKSVGSTAVSSSIDGDASNDYYSYDYATDTYANKTKSEYEDSSLEYAVDTGLSYVQLDATILYEVPLSYAKAYDWNSGYWSFGGSIKPMALTTYDKKVDLGKSSGDANDESDSSAYEVTYDNTVGLDLGIAYKPKDTDLTIGLVGKNINSPTFKVDKIGSSVSSAKDFEIDPYFRAGISYPVWNDNIEFALDVDLQKSDTILVGEETQMIGTGIELHPASWFSLRFGAMTDLAAEAFDDGVIGTFGVGFGLKWFQLDLSAMVASESGQYDGNDIPRYAAVNLSIVSRWGEGYNEKKTPLIIEESEKPNYETKTKVLTDEKMEELETELDKETAPEEKKNDLNVEEILNQ